MLQTKISFAIKSFCGKMEALRRKGNNMYSARYCDRCSHCILFSNDYTCSGSGSVGSLWASWHVSGDEKTWQGSGTGNLLCKQWPSLSTLIWCPLGTGHGCPCCLDKSVNRLPSLSWQAGTLAWGQCVVHKRSEFYATRVFEKCSWEGTDTWRVIHSLCREVQKTPTFLTSCPFPSFSPGKQVEERTVNLSDLWSLEKGRQLLTFFFFL